MQLRQLELFVAVGFAAQDLLKNLFGGIILVFDQPSYNFV